MMSPTVSLLRRIAGGAETPADRAALAERVQLYLSAAADGVSLDQAFGLATPAGQLPWWRAEALSTRDAALRAMAARFHASQPLARQAAEIRAALLAYATTGWRFDRRELSPPTVYIGTPREMLFDALKASETVPSVQHIRRVLRGR